MSSPAVEAIAFWMKCGSSAVFLVYIFWTALPLFRRDFREVRARLSFWIVLPVVYSLGYTQDPYLAWLRRVAQGLARLSPVHKIIRTSELPLYYFEDMLPYLIVTAVLTWLLTYVALPVGR
jgi:hypothetical protein